MTATRASTAQTQGLDTLPDNSNGLVVVTVRHWLTAAGVVGVLLTSGCQMMTEPPSATMLHGGNQAAMASTAIMVTSAAAMNNQRAAAELQPPQLPSNSFVPLRHHKQLADYVEQMVMAMMPQLQQRDVHAIAVTSFVEFDDSLERSTILGNQLAEDFMAEARKQGLAVVDFKQTGKIRVTRHGDFSFSRNADALNDKLKPEYILSGVVRYGAEHVKINARLVSVADNQVVASSDGQLPYFVVKPYLQ